MSDLDLNARVTIPSHVVYREFPAETVVLNLETGRYHGINASGGAILTSLERTSTIGAAVEALADRYGRPQADVEEDVRTFCAELLERGLIQLEPTIG